VAVTVFDVVTEASLFGSSLLLVQGLQLSLHKKLVVLFAFGLRLPVIAIAVLRLYYLAMQFSSSDPSLDGVTASVCTEIELCYAIVATTMPCLKPFMSALNTNYGGPTNTKTPPGSKATGYDRGYALANLSASSKQRGERTDKPPQAPPQTRWDGAEYNVAVNTVGDRGSLQSNDSKKMIISKNTAWAVDYEDQRQTS